MPPKYNFEKIKFATDPGTFEKAVKTPTRMERLLVLKKTLEIIRQ